MTSGKKFDNLKVLTIKIEIKCLSGILFSELWP